jgi:hypothetical protein
MSTTGPGSNLHVEPIATRGEGPARCVFQQQEEHTRAGLPPCPLLLASLVSNFGHAHEQYMSSSVLTPLRSTLHTLVKACGRLVGTANLHLSEVGHAALATFARTFGCWQSVHLFPMSHSRAYAHLLSCPRSSSCLRRPAHLLRPSSPCSCARSSDDRGSFGMDTSGIRSGSCQHVLGLRAQVRGV